MTVLCDKHIRFNIQHFQLIDLYDDLETQLQPASFDVRVTDVRDIEGNAIKAVDGGWVLPSLGFALASTIEVFAIPFDMTARLEGKSTTARRALQIHAAGNIDPGFQGAITLELFNQGATSIFIEHGRAIGQVSFSMLSEECERPYGHDRGSHYQGQRVTTPAHTVRALAEQAACSCTKPACEGCTCVDHTSLKACPHCERLREAWEKRKRALGLVK